MVRRAILDGDDQLTAAGEEALSDAQLHPGVRPGRAAARWQGGGGRWLIWLGRAVVWAVILLVGYRGVLAIVGSQHSAPESPASPTSGSGTSQFPQALAAAYALDFGSVYLNFSPSTASSRGRQLAAFLPPGTDTQLGWNGAGTQRLLDEQVAGITVTGAHTAVVTLLGRLGSGRLIELGVPVYASGGGMSVSGEPALLPAPAKAVAPLSAAGAADQTTQAQLQGQLAAFFQAYGNGDQATLARFVTPGGHITGLGGAVSLSAVDSVYVPAGGATRTIAATVTWRLPSGSAAASAATPSASPTLQMTYQMTVVRHGNDWDVQSIGASTQSPAQGPP